MAKDQELRGCGHHRVAFSRLSQAPNACIGHFCEAKAIELRRVCVIALVVLNGIRITADCCTRREEGTIRERVVLEDFAQHGHCA